MPKKLLIPKRKPTSKNSIWNGPNGEGPNGGITFSLLSRFLICRERFRLLVVKGLKPADSFNHHIEYGQMWHILEEYHAEGMPAGGEDALIEYCQSLCRQYPLQQEQIEHWYNVCRTQFPIYVKYWAKHPDVKSRTSLLQEQIFDVPYRLPSRRGVRLRGKWDSVDLIGKGKRAEIFLQENKTKGNIIEEQLKKQLHFDLQTGIYLTALSVEQQSTNSPACDLPRDPPIRGVRYNVVRRPLSGGKDSIRKHKPTKSNPTGETDNEFYVRLGSLIEDHPEYYFMRWKVEVTRGDLDRFCRECLDPILENLCDWWEWINSPTGKNDPFADHHVHWRHPFGVWNSLNEGGSSELDEYLASGSTAGLMQTGQLFGELQ